MKAGPNTNCSMLKVKNLQSSKESSYPEMRIKTDAIMKFNLPTRHFGVWRAPIFTVGEPVRSTCGNSHEEEKEKDRFLLSLHQTIL